VENIADHISKRHDVSFMPGNFWMGLVETVTYILWRFVELSIRVNLCPFSLGVGPLVFTLHLCNLLRT
jgi:hypothetical protein